MSLALAHRDEPQAADDRSEDVVEPSPAPSAPVVWCPVCGNAPARAEHRGFCSRDCRVASVEYHNTQALRADSEYDRKGTLAFDENHDRR